MAAIKLLPAPEPSLIFHGSEGPVTSLRFASTGDFAGNLLSGSVHTAVYLWDLLNLKRLACKFRCFPDAEKNTTVLWTHPCAQKTNEIVVQLRNGILQKWSVNQDQPQHLHTTNLGEQYGFCSGAAFEEQQLLCVPGVSTKNASTLLILEETSLAPVGAFIPVENHFSPMRMARHKEHGLLVAYEDAMVLMWDVRYQEKPLFQSDIFRAQSPSTAETDATKEMATPMALDIDSEKSCGILGSSTNAAQWFEILPSGISLKGSISLNEEGISDVKIRPDGKIFTLTSWDNTARVFSWKTLKALAVMDLHKSVIQRVEYAVIEGRNCVVLGGKDEMISVWPLY